MNIAVTINIFIAVPPVLSKFKKKAHKQNSSVTDHLNGVSKHMWLID
jgi:hypothetical protein